MITLSSISSSHKSRIVSTDFHPTCKDAYFFIIQYFEESPDVTKILGKTLDDFIKFKNSNPNPSDSELKEFFNTLNWVVASLFNKTTISQKGLSLAYVKMRNNSLKIIRYGRILLGIEDSKGFRNIGPEWKNHTVVSYDGLKLLGTKSEDLYPELYQIDLQGKGTFVLLDSNGANLFIENQIKLKTSGHTHFILNYDVLKTQKKK